ncbi:sodium-dependent phosphate transport protein 3 isoform X1 [Psammomys obesus]|uniref:sodium-dependent phosphate transport protein 3 isoform X1 n=2 Tax=Psammomys obesus TaxID=48139 RepID=UPI002453679A|nr:sodium-dependent phosphate transport protein 3 isoform X1 [Psammomys obesus]XP_055470443.1 sodium-dependent phosphate transport protein 3 isoform X1 [Psammomys obesus]XP_055470444.1 sodium-dependent phosphate transport protein 3 isoform X1 [Psammomys obesus]
MDEKPTTVKGSGFCSIRYALALIMHFSNFTMITQRVSLSIAMIAMVNSTQHQDPANAHSEGPWIDPSNQSRGVKDFSTRAAVYQWSTETQGIIFSSISYGIILTLIPSGYLAGIFGAKQILGAGLLVSSLLTLFTPLAANFGVILVIIIRTVQGMAQGMAWTGQFTIWAKWAPPLERSKLTSIAGSGAAFGSFIILCVGGLISQALGWPFIFYIFGSIGCVCCVLWFTVIYDDPIHHPCISAREKEHITSSLAQQSSSPRRSVPIKAMVRCLPLWAIFMGFFSHFWLCTIIITYLPTYISTVLHVNIRDSGVLSSLPFIAASSCTILGGQMADFLLSRNLLSLITVRKLFSSLGLLLPSLCAVALPFVTSSYIATIVLLILIPGTSNLCDSGFIINTLDVAPRYASFLMGISRGFGLTAGIISSTTTGFLISQVGHVIEHLRVAGFGIRMEECVFPVCWCQHVRSDLLPHIWTSRNPELGQGKDSHPPLRMLDWRPNKVLTLNFLTYFAYHHSFFVLLTLDTAPLYSGWVLAFRKELQKYVPRIYFRVS